MLERGDPRLLATEVGRATHKFYQAGDIYRAFEKWSLTVIGGGADSIDGPEVARPLWEESTRYADNYNDPGRFTAVIGYGWSSAPSGKNLHRVVDYREDAENAHRFLPFGATDSANPEDLWARMEIYEAETGGDLLPISHNGNLFSRVMSLSRICRELRSTPTSPRQVGTALRNHSDEGRRRSPSASVAGG